MEDEFEEDNFGVGKENDEQLRHQNRLRRRCHFVVQRSRPISYPPSFSFGAAFSTPLYMKGNLMDRKPQKLIEPISEEVSSRIGRKVKFADEAGKQLASYIEIPNKFDRYGFRSLTNISSIFDEMMGKDLNEIEQVFDSAFSRQQIHQKVESRSECKENTDSSLGCKRKYNTQSHVSFPKEKFPRAQAIVVSQHEDTKLDKTSSDSMDRRRKDHSAQPNLKIRKHSLEGCAISETDEENSGNPCDSLSVFDKDENLQYSNSAENQTESTSLGGNISTMSWQPGDYLEHYNDSNKDQLTCRTTENFRNIPCHCVSTMQEVPILHKGIGDNLNIFRKTEECVPTSLSKKSAKNNEQLFEELIKKLHSAGQGSDSSCESNDHTPVISPLSPNETPIPVYHNGCVNLVQTVVGSVEGPDISPLHDSHVTLMEESSERSNCDPPQQEATTHNTPAGGDSFRKDNANEELSFTVVLDSETETPANQNYRDMGVSVDYTLPFESSDSLNKTDKECKTMTSSFEENPNISFTIISPVPSSSDVTDPKLECQKIYQGETTSVNKQPYSEIQQCLMNTLPANTNESNFITKTNSAIADILSVFDEVYFPDFSDTSCHSYNNIKHEGPKEDKLSCDLLGSGNNSQFNTGDMYSTTGGMLGVNHGSESGYGTHSFISDDFFNEDSLSVCTSGFELDDVFEEASSNEVLADSESISPKALPGSVSAGQVIKGDWEEVIPEVNNSSNSGEYIDKPLVSPLEKNRPNQGFAEPNAITMSDEEVTVSDDCILESNGGEIMSLLLPNNTLESDNVLNYKVESGEPGEYMSDHSVNNDSDTFDILSDNELENASASILNIQNFDLLKSQINDLSRHTDINTNTISPRRPLAQSYSGSEHSADNGLNKFLGELSSCSGHGLSVDKINTHYSDVKCLQDSNHNTNDTHSETANSCDSGECKTDCVQIPDNSNAYNVMLLNNDRESVIDASYCGNNSDDVLPTLCGNSMGEGTDVAQSEMFHTEITSACNAHSDSIEAQHGLPAPPSDKNLYDPKADSCGNITLGECKHLSNESDSFPVKLNPTENLFLDQGLHGTTCAINDAHAFPTLAYDTSLLFDTGTIHRFNETSPTHEQSFSNTDAASPMDESMLAEQTDKALAEPPEVIIMKDEVIESSDMEVYMPKNIARTLVDCMFRKKCQHDISDSDSSESSCNIKKHKVPERKSRRETNMARRSKVCDKPLRKTSLYIQTVVDNDNNSGDESDIESFTSEESQGGSDITPNVQSIADLKKITTWEYSSPTVIDHIRHDNDFECSESTSITSADTNVTDISCKLENKDSISKDRFQMYSHSSDNIDGQIKLDCLSSGAGLLALISSSVEGTASVSTNSASPVSALITDTQPPTFELSTNTVIHSEDKSMALCDHKLSDGHHMVSKCSCDSNTTSGCADKQSDEHSLISNSSSEISGGRKKCVTLHKPEVEDQNSISSASDATCSLSSNPKGCATHKDNQNYSSNENGPENMFANNNMVTSKDTPSEHWHEIRALSIDNSNCTGSDLADSKCRPHLDVNHESKYTNKGLLGASNKSTYSIKDRTTVINEDTDTQEEAKDMHCKDTITSTDLVDPTHSYPLTTSDNDLNITVIITSEGKLIVQDDES